MEIKDWIYTAGILFTFIVSAFSAYLNLINRRNGAREHLYKEQFAFYKLLIAANTEIMGQINQVIGNPPLSRFKKDEITKLLIEQHKRVVENAFLIPNTLETHLRNARAEGWKVMDMMSIKGTLTEDDNEAIAKAYSNVIDYIRNEIGTDKLSEENKRVMGSVIIKEA
jgi:hypothetical protein